MSFSQPAFRRDPYATTRDFTIYRFRDPLPFEVLLFLAAERLELKEILRFCTSLKSARVIDQTLWNPQAGIARMDLSAQLGY